VQRHEFLSNACWLNAMNMNGSVCAWLVLCTLLGASESTSAAAKTSLRLKVSEDKSTHQMLKDRSSHRSIAQMALDSTTLLKPGNTEVASGEAVKAEEEVAAATEAAAEGMDVQNKTDEQPAATEQGAAPATDTAAVPEAAVAEAVDAQNKTAEQQEEKVDAAAVQKDVKEEAAAAAEVVVEEQAVAEDSEPPTKVAKVEVSSPVKKVTGPSEAVAGAGLAQTSDVISIPNTAFIGLLASSGLMLAMLNAWRLYRGQDGVGKLLGKPLLSGRQSS